ncbi:MAG: hypothetical protein II899_05945 [Bacteroidales bacterium]|nr:hypothetical protein [Bacteroidales bacterium]
MKKLALLAFVVAFAAIASAQTAKESMVNMGKQQLSGYLLDIPGADMKTVEAAFRDKLEKQYNLKASSESGFRAYLNQPFQPFGSANYDLYFNVSEHGKKKNKVSQISLIVCSGNMNTITSQNDPTTADYVKVFLRDFVSYVQEYVAKQNLNELENQMAKLVKEKNSLEKDQTKINKQIQKLNKDLEKNAQKTVEKEEKIKDLQKEIDSAKRQLR